MPQVLKEEVERRIRAAALEVFAEQGYPAASMTDIARRADVSAGNIYRYFPSKKALFAAVVPASVASRMVELLRRRMEAARGQEDLDAVATVGSGYPLAARATVDYALQHRAEAVVLLARGAGTPYADLAEDVVDFLVKEAVRYVRSVRPGKAITGALRFDLQEIYRSYVRAWARILECFPEPDDARQALADYERYHLGGLRALFS